MQQRAATANNMQSTLTQEELDLMKKSGAFSWNMTLTPEEQARGHCNHYNGQKSTVVKLNETDERHPECDVLHCTQCNTTWTDMSTKDDEWWRNLGKDVVSAFQTLKYMNIIPYDATRSLGDFCELLAKIFSDNVPNVRKAWGALYNNSYEPNQNTAQYNAFNGVYNTSNWGTQYGYQSMMAQNPYMQPQMMGQQMVNPMMNPMMAQQPMQPQMNAYQPQPMAQQPMQPQVNPYQPQPMGGVTAQQIMNPYQPQMQPVQQQPTAQAPQTTAAPQIPAAPQSPAPAQKNNL